MGKKNITVDAISQIEQAGILLVFPIKDRKEPPSLWSKFWPRSEMKWEWDENGDHRVADLWHLREELSRSGKVVYTKWYQGRATFFSKKVFVLTLAALRTTTIENELSDSAKNILRILKMDSPLATKDLKALSDLKGKIFESEYQKALKELWSRLLIVGFGEVNEGGFPSLAVGATQALFEDLWHQSFDYSAEKAKEALKKLIPENSLFLKQMSRVK